MKEIKILFVCHGNICRSPMAEFVMKKLVAEKGLEDRFYIESKATSSEEIYRGIGNPIYPPALRELEKHGIKAGDKRANRLLKEDYEKFDYLIGMDDRNISNMEKILGRSDKTSMLLSYAGDNRSIADPWYSGDFSKSYEDIELGCRELLAYLIKKYL